MTQCNNRDNNSGHLQIAIFAGGCFWGVEHYMQQEDGVLSVESGYIGGTVVNPSYKEVKTQSTGHAEAVRVVFDSSKVSYEKLARLFFEIHDPTQLDRQGIDIGSQYRSEIFWITSEQREVADRLIKELKTKGFDVVTKLTEASEFYSAEEYHQDYFERNGGEPDCHFRVKRF